MWESNDPLMQIHTFIQEYLDDGENVLECIEQSTKALINNAFEFAIKSDFPSHRTASNFIYKDKSSHNSVISKPPLIRSENTFEGYITKAQQDSMDSILIYYYMDLALRIRKEYLEQP